MSKKLLRALGLESDVPAVVEPEVEPSFNEASVLIVEGESLIGVEGDTLQTIATLETIDTILAGAPEDQITETTAAIVDAAMQDITGRYEMAKECRLAAESFRSVGNETYLRIAREDVSSKLDGFKKGVATIIEKIIELMQKFWQWLTMNHKRVKASLAAATTAVKAADGEQTIPFQVKFRTLLTNDELSVASIEEGAEAVHDLCSASAKFITESFNISGGNKVFAYSNITNEIKKYLGEYATSTPGEYLFYSNIAGRKFALALNPDLKDSAEQTSQQVFETSLTPIEARQESPENIVVGKHDVEKMLQAATAVVDISDQEFAKINKIQESLKRNRQLFAKGDKLVMPSKVVAAYNKCIVHFIDGVFTQALRHGNAVAALGQAYAKQGNNIAAEA